MRVIDWSSDVCSSDLYGSVPPRPAPPAPIVEERPQPLHTPPAWTPSRGGSAARQPTARVQNANAAARVEPRREGYYNAIQVYPYSEGALSQVYAPPGQKIGRASWRERVCQYV